MDRLSEAGIEPSVSSVDDSYDNALAETTNGLYKAEVIHRLGPWRNLQAVEMATLEWLDWFNHRRLLESISNVPPAKAEAAYDDQLVGSAIGRRESSKTVSGNPGAFHQTIRALSQAYLCATADWIKLSFFDGPFIDLSERKCSEVSRIA